MWEFTVELELNGISCGCGVYVDARTGEIVLFEYDTGGNG